MSEKIIGHKKIIEFFLRTIENKKMGQAYCFFGSEKVGKRTVAEYISAKLLNVELSALKKERDIYWVEQIEDEKTGKTKKDITIGQIREMISFVGQKSFANGYKIVIIDNAHKMNSAAANTLLKTLEEPRGQTVLFLITSERSALPATILSRCQNVFFKTLPFDIILDYFEEKNEENIEMAKMSRGLPGRMIEWSQNKDKFLEYKREIERFRSLFNQPFYKKLKLTEDLFVSEDHIAQREKIKEILEIWEMEIGEKVNSADADLNAKTKMIELYDKIKEGERLILENIHPKLLLENIFLILP